MVLYDHFVFVPIKAQTGSMVAPTGSSGDEYSIKAKPGVDITSCATTPSRPGSLHLFDRTWRKSQANMLGVVAIRSAF